MGDLLGEGNIGLLTAVDKYKFEKGGAFSTCAIYWIRQAIIRNCMHKRRIVRLPENISELMRSDRWSGIQYREVSIDSPNDEGDSMAADIPDPTNFQLFLDEEEMLINRRVENVLAFLKDRDAQVVRAYYGIGNDNVPMDVEKVAEQFDLSTTRFTLNCALPAVSIYMVAVFVNKIGAEVSVTSTVKDFWEIFPEGSLPINLTILTPSLEQPKMESEKYNCDILQLSKHLGAKS
jgi:RNA polymerase sigma factor (sigma-70 family)